MATPFLTLLTLLVARLVDRGELAEKQGLGGLKGQVVNTGPMVIDRVTLLARVLYFWGLVL